MNTQQLIEATSCYDCIPSGRQLGVLIYLLNQLSVNDFITYEVVTTDNTDTPLAVITPVDSAVVQYEARIAASQDDDSNGASYVSVATFRVVAGVPALVGQTDLVQHEDAPQWQIDWDVDGSNVRLLVQGANGQTVNWKAQISNVFAL